MNLIPEIAKKLGVGMNEDFRIKTFADNPGKELFKFDINSGLLAKLGTTYIEVYNKDIFKNLLTGEFTIVKLPYRPKLNDRYYIVGLTPGNEPVILSRVWRGTISDLQNRYCGNCFRTQEEAENGTDDVLGRLAKGR